MVKCPSPDECTACTICTAHCPVARATPRFRGPKFTGPAYERFRRLGFGDEASLEYCSNCKNCEIACPSGVPVAAFNMLARAEYCKAHPQPLRDRVLGRIGLMGRLTGHMPAPLINFGLSNPVSRRIMDFMGIDKRAPLPSFAPLKQRRAIHKRRPAAARQAVLFLGCHARYYEPQVAFDLVAILEKAGYSVIVPASFRCCGLPLVAGGFAAAALDHARTNSTELARWARAGIPVLAVCPSCALMLRKEYRELFPDQEDLGRYAASVVEACAFVLALVLAGELSLRDARATGSYAYHAPCHLRALGGGRTGLDLLGLVPGFDLVDTDAGCCGISGSYGFKKGKYAIGMDVGAPLFAALKKSGASAALSECGTCRIQMRHGSGLPAEHPLSVVRRALA